MNKRFSIVLKCSEVLTRFFFSFPQALRDEIVQLEEQHRQHLTCQKSEHRQIMELKAAEQLSMREELRKELAQVHIEKFSAMAAELSHVHKVRNDNK